MRYLEDNTDLSWEVWENWRDQWSCRAANHLETYEMSFHKFSNGNHMLLEDALREFGPPTARDGNALVWRVGQCMMIATLKNADDPSSVDRYEGGFPSRTKARVEAHQICGRAVDVADLVARWDKKSKPTPTYVNTPTAGTAYMMVMQQGTPSFQPVACLGADLVRENYAPNVLKGYDTILNSMNSKEPVGRLSILNGPPGTGKTRMIRSFIQNVSRALHVIIAAKEIEHVGDPVMLTCLLSLQQKYPGHRIVLYLEDADPALCKRDEKSAAAISTLLNATDGMIGAVLNMYVVATTNQDVSEIDPALKRPGRMDVQMDVGPLEAEQANRVFARIAPQLSVGRMFSTPKTVAEIYHSAGVFLREKSLS